jgi:hypothetical protein
MKYFVFALLAALAGCGGLLVVDVDDAGDVVDPCAQGPGCVGPATPLDAGADR